MGNGNSQSRYTDEDVINAYVECRSFRKAADKLGCRANTVRDRIRKLQAAGVDVWHGVDEKEVAAKEKNRVRELEAVVSTQKKQLENLKRANWSLPAAARGRKGVKKPTGKSFTRVIVPDTHGCFVDEPAINAFLNDLSALAPREVVMLGDHLDCGGFLAEHHTLGYVAEMEYNFADDVAATNWLLNKIQELSPSAVIHYLEGNHERRIEKYCVTAGRGNKEVAAYFRDMFSTEKVLGLKERGIHYYKQGRFYMDLPVPATIKLGQCHFTHGIKSCVHAAHATLKQFSGNVVFGHTHRADSFVDRTVSRGIIGAWNPGCLCRLQPLWQHTNVTGWSHGYGLQLVRPDGNFLHINVPIINGESYLVDLTERM